MKICKRLHGFTLIELLIVITIIGILAVALVPRITGGPAKARDATRKADLQQIATALEFYNDDTGGYPASDDCVANLGLEGYLTIVPTDPQDLSAVIATDCSADGGYEYVTYEDEDGGYMLIATMESESSDDIYRVGSVTRGAITDAATTSASVAFDGLVGRDCVSVDCSGKDTMYLLGR